MTYKTFTVDQREHATMLAALRYWQRDAFDVHGSIEHLPEAEIATDGGTVEPMDPAEIDDLSERVNIGMDTFGEADDATDHAIRIAREFVDKNTGDEIERAIRGL